MHVSLAGRRALVTGGVRGIGAAIVRQLVEAGAQVVTTATAAPSAARVTDSTELAVIDFTDLPATERFAEAMALRDFDVLVNNAGINKIAVAGDMVMSDWDRIQAVNVRAPTVLCRALAPRMAARGYGRIINISSVFGDVSRTQRAAYTTSKFAIRGFTKTLALDYAARNVLVNAVAPGFVDTELTRTVLGEAGMRAMEARIPMGRLANADEIARVVTFLASDANTYLTGQHIVVDGGFTSE